MQLKPFDVAHQGSVEVQKTILKDGQLQIRYLVQSPSLIFPEKVECPRRIDGLYQTTCFELFIRRAEQYLEWNVSPSGDWCVFYFEKYRERRPKAIEQTNPILEFRRGQGESQFQVDVTFDVSVFCQLLNWSASDLNWQPTVVLDHGERRSYWAIQHPSSKPDFHVHHDQWLKLIPGQ